LSRFKLRPKFDVMNKALLVVSDGHGNIFEIPEYHMCGMSGTEIFPVDGKDLISLPYGSDLFELPGRIAIGFDPHKNKHVEIKEYQGNRVYPVAAFMAPAYLQIFRSAFNNEPDSPRLPLYNYAAVGWWKDDFCVAGIRIDEDIRQDLHLFNSDFIENEAKRLLKKFPKNRLVHHLIENCVFRYRCPAARNFALGRWECPIPTSPGCNSACVGCISEQPAENEIVSPQDRIEFTPTADEIVEFTVPHLQNAPRAVVSFGQGCEGEPLLAGEVLVEAVRQIRKRTDRGIINLNTNASRPDVIERLCEAGLDSIRASTNSAQKKYYDLYYNPRHYSFDDVVESLRIMRKYDRWSSINYLTFPGLTDHPQELAALETLIEETGINMIQTRNLNIDPDWYMDKLGLRDSPQEQIGMQNWVSHLRDNFPAIKLGYFNPPKEEIETIQLLKKKIR
jgi:wyosine [tRNA(Phe)-imidazoG37] synthetase (radical SAM superfamily)